MQTRRIPISSQRPEQLELAILEAGVGGRPLLLVHGFTGAKEDFADEVDGLAAIGFHVVAPDHRGHGSSDQPTAEDQYSFELFATDMFGLADAIGWGRFDLLGHSMGGMVAQTMALDRPGRIGRLVLMDTHHGSLDVADADSIALGIELARTDGLAVIQELLKSIGDPLDNPAYRRVCAEREGFEAWSESKMVACSAAMYAAMLPRFAGTDDRLDQLATLPHDTLVLVGELDRPFLQASRDMVATIPAARLVVLPEGGHSPQFESTTAWRHAVHSFLLEDGDGVGREAVASAS